MKYSILGFNQEKVLALRSVNDGGKKTSKIDTIDLLILRSISNLITNEKVFKHIIDGKAYSRVHYKAILEDLPILGIKKQALVDRIDKLCLFGLIEKRVIRNATGTWTAFCITDRFSSILYKGRKVENKQSYSEKLKDPRWQRKRLEILSRDNYKCQMCGNTSRTLHVHHLFYKYGVEPWDYDNDTLVTLCEKCHSKTHSKTHSK